MNTGSLIDIALDGKYSEYDILPSLLAIASDGIWNEYDPAIGQSETLLYSTSDHPFVGEIGRRLTIESQDNLTGLTVKIAWCAPNNQRGEWDAVINTKMTSQAYYETQDERDLFMSGMWTLNLLKISPTGKRLYESSVSLMVIRWADGNRDYAAGKTEYLPVPDLC